MKQKIKGIVGITIMLIALAATYIWMNFGRPELESITLLVASKDIPKGIEIVSARELFTPLKIMKTDAIKGAISPEQLENLEGRITGQFIPQNSQISVQAFSNQSLDLKDNQFVFKLPPSWVYTMPSTIRRGDKVSIYEIDAKIDNQQGAAAGDFQQTTSEAIKMGAVAPILSTSVVYVKDSTNREVVDTNGNQRLDGSSQVYAIEIICTREDTMVLENSIIKGSKFIVVYN